MTSGNEIVYVCLIISFSASFISSIDKILLFAPLLTLELIGLRLYRSMNHVPNLCNQATALFNLSHDEWRSIKLERTSSL